MVAAVAMYDNVLNSQLQDSMKNVGSDDATEQSNMIKRQDAYDFSMRFNFVILNVFSILERAFGMECIRILN